MHPPADQPAHHSEDPGTAIAELLAWSHGSAQDTDGLDELLAGAIVALEQVDMSPELRSRALTAVEQFRDASVRLHRAADPSRMDLVQAARQGVPPYMKRFSQWKVAKSRVETLLPAIARAMKRAEDARSPLMPDVRPTDTQRDVWDALAGKCRTAKQLAVDLGLLPTSEDLVRKRIKRMRDRGLVIETDRSQGYWRPDAPPPRFQAQPDSPASG